MGLVGYVLLPLLGAPPAHLMPTAAFLTRPASWLALITRVRGTLSVAPNAAYGLCVRRVSDEELARLDLSSWRMAYNGSEPVTREAVEAFVRRFEVAGFRASAMVPAYGLAENTLTATARRPGQGARFEDVSRDALEQEGLARPCRVGEAGRTTASVGTPLPGQEIRIAGPDGAPLGERRVGEVLLRGPTLMHGYLPGTEGPLAIGPDGWLWTGDLGYLADGELFLVGRTKDLIIRLGRNYHPEDLEEAAAGVVGVRAGRVVAFATPGSQRERVVVAAEVRSSGEGPAALRAAIEAAVFGAVRFMPDEVLLLAPHTLPLTTSGKVMRPETRRRYEAGELAAS
jgi:acyl-CoA synthetase (AMP-forming)/AMP-acid ligase II